MLNWEQGRAHKGRVEAQGSNRNQGNNKELRIAETQLKQGEGIFRRSIEMQIR